METEFVKNYLGTVAGFNRNVRLLLLRTIMMGLYTGIHGLIFNFYILEMGYKADFLGLLISISLLASSTMSIPAGVLCDRFDRRKLLVISSVLAMLATLPVFLLRDPSVMLLFSAAGGMFGSISAVCLTPILSDNCKRDGTVHVFSANASLGWIASVIGCALGGLLPGLMIAHLPLGGSGYQLTLIASVALLGLSCLFALLLKKGNKCAGPAPKAKAKSRFRFSLKDLRPSPTVLKFTLTSVTFGVASGMIVPYFNVYFMKVLHMDVVQIGLTSAAAGAFMLVGFIITPYATSKIGKVRSAVVTKLISAPFVVAMAFTKDFMIAAGAYVVYMFLINMAGPATTSFQMEQIKKHEQGFAIGLMSTGSCLAVSASSFVSGLLISRGNYTVPFILTCAGYVATAVLLYHYFKDVEPLPLLRPVARVAAD
ncbi:MFS transporter [Methanocella sp. MCL-LM]|uniref:MFS transporter n=1 Tax=Methanocella sp. MCL-LM TaxID=3412035 RepID=UPI003C78C00F